MASKIENDRQLIVEAKTKGKSAVLKSYIKLSGPGWLQSAITLGGGSLSSSLYLGVLAGFALLWLQPLAMILGIVMLSAIGYVALSTGEKPFRAINKHVNPVLGWGWLIATMMANCVWSLPQFSLACGSIRQNLMPDTFGSMPVNTANAILAPSIAVLCIVMVYLYDSQGFGYKLFNLLLKLMVAAIVISFFGVVIYMSIKGRLDWGGIFGGLVPNFRMLWQPADTFKDALAAVGPDFRGYWTGKIVTEQQDVLVAAAATAVGINMTFLLPYSMLKRGWNRDFRGLAIFDLSTGLFIPFILATGCVVIASASQFHVKPAAGLLPDVQGEEAAVQGQDALVTDANQGRDGLATDPALLGRFQDLVMDRIRQEQGRDDLATDTKLVSELPLAERRIAAMLVRRDANHLAMALSPLTGKVVAHYVFGIGVVGMAISSIIILMLINGFCVTEIIGIESKGLWYRLGSILPAVGLLGPFFWNDAAPYLAVPTSVFGFILIPIAYITFALVMNQKKLLGDDMPSGVRRIVWNVLMIIAVVLVTVGAVYMVKKKAGWVGIGGVVAFIMLAVVVHFIRKVQGKESLL
jgi:Mn2+/Fe2+ NRAMP family transporter